MKIDANTIENYLDQIPEERKPAINRIIDLAEENLPKGFIKKIQYGMITWCVPLETYPNGYHCTPNTPLPFLSLASQKNFIALYHMGLYANEKLYQWFLTEYPKHSNRKLDIGKSCIRFKKMDDIPFDLLADLFTKMSPEAWIELYEKNLKK